MTLNTYKFVFSVQISHSYFYNNEAIPVQFIPNKITQNIFIKFGFVIQKTPTGFNLYSNTTETLEALLTYIATTTEVKSFEFNLTTSDSFFPTYTADFPIENIGMLTYTTSANNNALQARHIAQSDFNNFGELTIHFKDFLKYFEDNSPVNYKISLEARLIQWQYYLISEQTLDLSEIYIKTNSNIQFHKTERRILNNKSAIVFSSNTLIPLRNFNEHKFDLYINEKKIIDGLPIPNANKVDVVLNNGEKTIISEMYLYL
ncbi:hypothetical protein [Polaribacter sp.]|uniref:hypothetical protein n=1 Tax=Polaribacter sp. TaxID=1920175 RepID=UPI003EF3F02A